MKGALFFLFAVCFPPQSLSNTRKRVMDANYIRPELEVESFPERQQPESPNVVTVTLIPTVAHKGANKLKKECSKAMRKPHQTPSNTKIFRLYCKNGYSLEVSKSGVVRGTSDKSSRYTLFELQSLGPGIIRIKSHVTKDYIAMDSKGYLYSTPKPRDECLFAANQLKNLFVTYQSCKRYLKVLRNRSKYYSHKAKKRSLEEKWYIGLKGDGKAKRGQQTVVRQSGTQFLPIELLG